MHPITYYSAASLFYIGCLLHGIGLGLFIKTIQMRREAFKLIADAKRLAENALWVLGECDAQVNEEPVRVLREAVQPVKKRPNHLKLVD